MNRYIKVRKACEHNLKNIDIDLPKENLIVFTGLSGSGKSSLAFDTIYTEGQRRYVESLSNYTKQFLGVMKKPKIDSIEGLSPSIAIEQKTSSSNPRSTVGTVTEIFDFIRMLYARTGHQYCYKCHQRVDSRTRDEIKDSIINYLSQDEKFLVIAPFIDKQKGNLKNSLDYLRSGGFHRILLDGEEFTLDEDIDINPRKFHKLHVIVDRLKMRSDIHERLAESIETALELAEGNLIIRNMESKSDKFFSERNYCQKCQLSYPDLSPNSFSFNTPKGSCSDCHGLGIIRKIDIKKLLKFPEKSILGGAIPYINGKTTLKRSLFRYLESKKIDKKIKIKDLPKNILEEILFGVKSGRHKFEGIASTIERRYRETSSALARKYYESLMMDQICSSCEGKRLRPESLSVLVNGMNIDQVSKLEIEKLYDFIISLPQFLTNKENFIVKELLKEVEERLGFLVSVGLSYLTLNRSSRTLSGGEAQRIRLASQIASGLTGVIYVLDEPSIGLHQKDNKKLLDNLTKLRDKGNTVIVVEHDRDTIENADIVVDFGPQAGVYGGEVIFLGSPEELKKADTETASFINRSKNVSIPKASNISEGKIKISNITTNNLKNINVEFEINKINVVTGVSGAGKSSLVMDTLFPALKNIAKNKKDLVSSNFMDSESQRYDHLEIIGINKDEKIFSPRLIKIDQSPIGRTPRSNPVTYIGAFDKIRDLLANTKLSKMRGYTKSRFSFNLKGGRCEKCQGSGVVKIEMHFLADVYVTCDICGGRRYSSETLEIEYKGKNINDILNMDVQEGYRFFEKIPSLKKQLGTLVDVGMGYIKLGQPSTTLSGGEAQRIKLARELSRTHKEGSIYILDEPTTGLHFQDVQKFLNVIKKLRDAHATLVIIEHNMDVIVNADHIIDLGPEGGPRGGHIIFSGSLDKSFKSTDSYTGKEILKELTARDECLVY